MALVSWMSDQNYGHYGLAKSEYKANYLPMTNCSKCHILAIAENWELKISKATNSYMPFPLVTSKTNKDLWHIFDTVFPV